MNDWISLKKFGEWMDITKKLDEWKDIINEVG